MVLSMLGCSKIIDDGVELIVENFRKFCFLDLFWCFCIIDVLLEYIVCDLS